MKPMDAKEREALIKDMQKTIKWFEGIKDEKPRQEKEKK